MIRDKYGSLIYLCAVVWSLMLAFMMAVAGENHPSLSSILATTLIFGAYLAFAKVLDLLFGGLVKKFIYYIGRYQ